ncbi:MAG: class I SAM-dependent methyltransferase [Anaerolineae bacterium]
MTLAAAVVGLVALGAIAYWALVVTEGAYLGPKVVIALYDRGASTYDDVKGFDVGDDYSTVAEPLLASSPAGLTSRILDVATGTARLPIALLTDSDFEGEVVGVDLSAGMLREAWPKVGGWTPRVHLIRAPAGALPFADATFDAVSCLEALEFTRRPMGTVAEMVRVLRPGGILVVTNRVGWEALLMPARALSEDAFAKNVEAFGVEHVRTVRWQSYYDLVWATKAGRGAEPPGRWPEGLRCADCRGEIVAAGACLRCTNCHRLFMWGGGAWGLLATASPGRGSDVSG